MLIDTHAHLEYGDLSGSTESVIDRARHAGVDRIISISCHPEGCDTTRDLAGRYPDIVYTSFGLHPHDAGAATVASLALIEPYLASPGVVAVGECGLDYSRLAELDNESGRDPEEIISEEKERQRVLTRAHILLANTYDLPVIFHVRDAHEDMQHLLSTLMPTRGGVIHSYTGTTDEAAWYLAHGFSFGINGIITFKKSEQLRSVVRSLPLSSLLLETDAPFLAPEPYRGKTNESSYMIETARVIADLFACSVEEVGRQTTETANRLFNFSASKK